MLGMMNIYWSHSIHKYRQINLLNYDCYQDVKKHTTSITHLFLKTIAYCTFKCNAVINTSQNYLMLTVIVVKL